MHNYKDLFFFFFFGKEESNWPSIQNLSSQIGHRYKICFLCQMLTPILDLYSFPHRASHPTMDYSQSSLAVSPQRVSLEDLRESYKPHSLHFPIHMEVEEAEHPSAHRTLGY
ncbi:LOW QUALITY PROTEIN: hypothetical protein TorRG33x02_269990 [Trema orientale]|uniref:Uncharacterized protein n=1 Tax=Trema orientale TaxID=63057 RepID=A0A2P5CX52_TREOI|nr:LOW QUALITY PROTEIN: hypothetical protein TorRG33x02_269990 [Trema orientale]